MAKEATNKTRTVIAHDSSDFLECIILQKHLINLLNDNYRIVNDFLSIIRNYPENKRVIYLNQLWRFKNALANTNSLTCEVVLELLKSLVKEIKEPVYQCQIVAFLAKYNLLAYIHQQIQLQQEIPLCQNLQRVIARSCRCEDLKLFLSFCEENLLQKSEDFQKFIRNLLDTMMTFKMFTEADTQTAEKIIMAIEENLIISIYNNDSESPPRPAGRSK